MTALHDLPGTRLLALFARRELSPSEYYEHLLAHIQRWEPHLNALYRFDPQRIREQAAAATERWRKGQPKGPLDGLPVTIKELIATAGEPIPLGSAATALQPAPCDAPPAARLREAGAIVLAKTTVPDFGLRVGLQLDPGCGLQPDAEIRAAIEAAARLFEEHGAQLRIVEPLMDRSLLDGLNDFWRARLWSELLLLDETRRARVLPYVHAWAEGGARVSGVDAVRGFNQTFEMRRRAARLFGEIDLLLTPTNQVEAFPADWASPLNDPQRPFEHIVFTVPWNMGEQPALSINCGFTAAGMPIGLQLVAPRFADTWLLRIGKTYEGWRGPIHGWPRPPAD